MFITANNIHDPDSIPARAERNLQKLADEMGDAIENYWGNLFPYNFIDDFSNDYSIDIDFTYNYNDIIGIINVWLAPGGYDDEVDYIEKLLNDILEKYNIPVKVSFWEKSSEIKIPIEYLNY